MPRLLLTSLLFASSVASAYVVAPDLVPEPGSFTLAEANQVCDGLSFTDSATGTYYRYGLASINSQRELFSARGLIQGETWVAEASGIGIVKGHITGGPEMSTPGKLIAPAQIQRPGDSPVDAASVSPNQRAGALCERFSP